MIGPRLFLAGRLLSISTATVDYYPGMYEVADGPDQVRAAARRQLARGADLVKVMATGAMLSSENEDARAIQYTLAELQAAVEIAHDNFKHVAAHAHAAGASRTASTPASTASSTAPSPTTPRSAASPMRASSWCPPSAPASCCSATQAVIAAMPDHLRSRMVESNDTHLATMRRAHELGVRIAMGTDAGTPGNHHGMNAHELVFMVHEMGMTPAEAIAASTINPARLLRREQQLGSIEVGKAADLIALLADPVRRDRGGDRRALRDARRPRLPRRHRRLNQRPRVVQQLGAQVGASTGEAGVGHHLHDDRCRVRGMEQARWRRPADG